MAHRMQRVRAAALWDELTWKLIATHKEADMRSVGEYG